MKGRYFFFIYQKTYFYFCLGKKLKFQIIKILISFIVYIIIKICISKNDTNIKFIKINIIVCTCLFLLERNGVRSHTKNNEMIALIGKLKS